MKEKLVNLIFFTAMIGLAFVIGCEFKSAEVCEESGKSFDWDFGVCK